MFNLEDFLIGPRITREEMREEIRKEFALYYNEEQLQFLCQIADWDDYDSNPFETKQ